MTPQTKGDQNDISLPFTPCLIGPELYNKEITDNEENLLFGLLPLKILETKITKSKRNEFKGVYHKSTPTGFLITAITGHVIVYVVNIMKDNAGFKKVRFFTIREMDSVWVPFGYAFGQLFLFDSVTAVRETPNDGGYLSPFTLDCLKMNGLFLNERDKEARLLSDYPNELLFKQEEAVDSCRRFHAKILSQQYIH